MIVNVGKPNAINHPQVITISYGWDFNHPHLGKKMLGILLHSPVHLPTMANHVYDYTIIAMIYSIV